MLIQNYIHRDLGNSAGFLLCSFLTILSAEGLLGFLPVKPISSPIICHKNWALYLEALSLCISSGFYPPPSSRVECCQVVPAAKSPFQGSLEQSSHCCTNILACPLGAGMTICLLLWPVPNHSQSILPLRLPEPMNSSP